MAVWPCNIWHRRLEKSIPLILAGKGLHDHYRKEC
jgi:hypothetical protein